MDKHDRLKKARIDAGFRSAAAAAERVGVPYGTYSGHENGGRGIKDDELKLYAKAFKASLAWLATGEGEQGINNAVGVKGLIGVGGSIETGSEQLDAEGNIFEVLVPVPVPQGAFALQVKGDSMWPRYDPEDIIVCSKPSNDLLRLIGWEAVVTTPEGNRYLKRLVQGSAPGLFTLESHNAAPLRDVPVSWASDVYAVVRAPHWQRLAETSLRQQTRKAGSSK